MQQIESPQAVAPPFQDVLILTVCAACGTEQYFAPHSLPGGMEHCPYCEECAAVLPLDAAKHDLDLLHIRLDGVHT